MFFQVIDACVIRARQPLTLGVRDHLVSSAPRGKIIAVGWPADARRAATADSDAGRAASWVCQTCPAPTVTTSLML